MAFQLSREEVIQINNDGELAQHRDILSSLDPSTYIGSPIAGKGTSSTACPCFSSTHSTYYSVKLLIHVLGSSKPLCRYFNLLSGTNFAYNRRHPDDQEATFDLLELVSWIHRKSNPAALENEFIKVVQTVVENKPDSETWSAVLNLLSQFQNYQKGHRSEMGSAKTDNPRLDVTSLRKHWREPFFANSLMALQKRIRKHEMEGFE